MQEESNPVKDYLFEYIEKSSTIPELMIQKKFDLVINEIIHNCYDKIISMGNKDESVGVLATGVTSASVGTTACPRASESTCCSMTARLFSS